MKITRIAAALAVTALALTGCGKQVELTATSTPAPSTSSTPSGSSGNFPTPDPADLSVTAEPADVSTPEPTPDDVPQTVRFGTTWEWEDGMQVTVSKPAKFRPSNTAAGAEKATKFVSFTITVKNGTKKKVDLIGMANMASGDTEAEEVFDSAKGIEGSPSTGILPGRKVVYKVAFGVEDPNDLVLQYSPTFSHEDAMFTSK